jgi:uncharacterized membrane protein
MHRSRSAIPFAIALLASIVKLNGLGFDVDLAHAQQSAAGQQLYVVDGLALGGMVHVESAIYKQYDCAPSTQFRDYTFCQRKKSDDGDRGRVFSTTSILHARDGTASYINRFIEPAFFNTNDVEAEVARLSTRFGQQPQIINIPEKSGAPNGRTAIWGTLRLKPLSEADMAVARAGKSPDKGILVDFVGDYSRSAQQGLPVYSIEGGTGFVWIASFDGSGRGRLRFFAIDAARLSSARLNNDQVAPPQPQVSQSTTVKPQVSQSTTVNRADQETKDRIIAEMRKAERSAVEWMEKCEPTCPDNPEAGKMRQDMLDSLDRENLATKDAESFTAALGNEDALTAYISSCTVMKCQFRDQAIAERDVLSQARADKVRANVEEEQFKSARGSMSALKDYLTDCRVCAFARQAAQEIEEASSRAENSLFKFKVCNNDYSDVSIAVAGQRDPNSDMWTAEGWWNLSSGECKDIGTFVKGYFYYTAYSFSRRIYWPNKEYQAKFFCIPNQEFTNLLYDGDECIGVRRGFAEAQVSDSEHLWPLKPLPWSYTALAYSPATSSWGWSGTTPSRQAAENSAMEGCRSHAWDCRVGAWVRDDQCLAMASGDNGDGGTSLGWASDSNLFQARIQARQQCRDANGIGCTIVNESCKP